MLPVRTSRALRPRASVSITATPTAALTARRRSTFLESRSSDIRDVSRRNFRSSSRLLASKRWENAATEQEDKAVQSKEPPSDGEPTAALTNEEGKTSGIDGRTIKEDPPQEAESSRAAQDRAKAEAAGRDSPRITASSTSSSSPSASNPQSSTGDNSQSNRGGEIAKADIPEVYPQVLALPLTSRPLFPLFYKAINIRDPAVIKAIKELIAHGQPYIGAFLKKDGHPDSDVITNVDEVHPVGIFAQITSTFETKAKDEDNKGGDKEEGAFTAVLFPLRRIRIDELLSEKEKDNPMVSIKPVEVSGNGAEVKENSGEAEVASFEQGVPSVEAVKKDIASETPQPTRVLSQVRFLHDLIPQISIANVSNVQVEAKRDTQMIRAIVNEMITVFKELANSHGIFREQIASFNTSHRTNNVFDEPDRLADFAAAVTSATSTELQAVLDSTSVEDRLQKALILLKKELINIKTQQKLSKDVDSKLMKRQKEFYLMEQMKGIRKELGMEGDGRDALVEKFKAKADKLAMPEGTRKVFDEELSKLMTLETTTSEYGVTRNYLDWLTSVPWGVSTPETFNIGSARQILEDDHYGLKDVKDRILEFLAIGKLKGTVQGKIICLSGPPGVGKTSIGKSIARALGRQFYRFSVGGLYDVGEIKGHRRTYIGAMPGKAIQALKQVQVQNPVILIDEIDKVGSSGRFNGGDARAALLEMLDPEQNSSFLDLYLDLPVDLSKVLFVCTANNLANIPRPLLDRLEVIELSGYVASEKKAIAEGYLMPQAKEASGLKEANVVVESGAIEDMIKWYARESGVRSLKKLVEKVYRKVAFKIVTDLGEDKLPEPEPIAASANTVRTVETHNPDFKPISERLPGDTGTANSSDETAVTTEPRQPIKVPEDVKVVITPDNLRDYIGTRQYSSDRLWTSAPPPGVSHGLAASSEDGQGWVLPIEVSSMPGKGNLQLTGKLGEVLRESAQLATSWVKANAFHLGITKSDVDTILTDRDIHLHVPEGATPKDGPSAGTALVVALVSLLTKTKVNMDTAMTGEISLLGQVLRVGGLKEKSLAAHRAGMKRLIAPISCKAEIEDNVPDSVKDGVEYVYVETINQLLQEAFRGEEVIERWRETLPIEREAERVAPPSTAA